MKHRPSHLLMALARFVCRAALRAVVTGVILTTCVTAALAYLGVPLPDVYELLEKFESVSGVARILS